LAARPVGVTIDRIRKEEVFIPFNPGFNKSEAEPLIALLSNLEGAPSPPFQQLALPIGWKILFDSQSVGPFNNRWQLAQSPSGQYAVLIRGTVYQTGSIIDDLLSVLIKANGSMGAFDYQFAAANATTYFPGAGVHLGFALAALIMLYYPADLAGILWQLPLLVPQNSDVFIAGHSQGAAIATLCTSFLNYPANLQPIVNNLGLNYNYNYKTYVFAQPRPGNDAYGNDYDSIVGNNGMAFTVNNSQDWVPQVPLTFELLDDVNTPNPMSVWTEKDSFVHKTILKIVGHTVEGLRADMAVSQVAKHLPNIQALNGILNDSHVRKALFGDQAPGPLASLDASSVLSLLVPSLNFTACGSPYILTGVHGVNPCDANKQPWERDFFWQHHLTMYYDLLQGISIPTTC
jgi:hypothetical protein